MPDENMIEQGIVPPGADQGIKVAPVRAEHRPQPRPVVEAGSLLSGAFDAQVLPPERFKGEQKGEIVDIKKIGDNIATLRKDGNHYVGYFIDGKGNSRRIMLDPSSHDVAEQIERQSIKAKRQAAGGVSPMDQFRKLGFSEKQAGQLTEDWYQVATTFRNEMYVVKNDITSRAPVYLPVGEWKMGVLYYKVGEKNVPRFTFAAGDSWFSLDPETGEKKKSPTPNEAGAEIVTHGRQRLVGDLHLRRESTIFQVKNNDGTSIADYSGTDPTVDPTDNNTLYYISVGRIYKLDLTGVVDRKAVPSIETQFSLGNIEEIEIDPHGNFILARTQDSKLHVLDKRSGDKIKEFDNVKGPVYIDSQGDIIYADTSGNLREIQTNFQAIPPGGSQQAEQQREEALREMQERFANLELGKVVRQQGDQISDADVANTLRESLARQVSDPITTATDPEALEDILDRLQGFKGDPANQAYGDVVDEFVSQAREKLSGIRTGELDSQLDAFSQQLENVASVGDTIGLDEQFARLLELRGKIDVTDPQKRREIEQKLRALQTSKETVNTRYQEELVEATQQMLPQIEELIRETGSAQELGYFSTSTSAQQFEQMLANIRDPEVRRELRGRYTQIRTEHRASLETRTREIDEQDRQRWAQVVDEAREDLTNLREQIEALSDSRELDRFGRNPLVTAWRAKLFALPPEVRAIEEQKLEIILGARKKDVEHRRELGAVGEGGELKFGESTFPVYKEPPVIWQPRFIPIKGSMPGYADLVFEDSNGRVFKPNEDHNVVVQGDATNPETQAAIDRYREAAKVYFEGMKRRVPDFDEHWRITDFHMERLEEIAEALNLQLANHRGILLLQGEAGTGKNVMADMLSNLSNRELVQIACNENSTKEDLTYDFYYDPQRGTYKLPSRLIEAIQTPGATILFDEINALKPGLAKMLNSLFDYRRRIYVMEGGKEKEIIVDPTVLFIGTMNPQNYAGVNRLSPEVKSRSRVVDIDYPPFEENRGGRTHYRSDEAEMLAAYMDDLGDLKQAEFKKVWDYVINNDTTNGADVIVDGNPGMAEDTRRVYDVIRVANRLRDMYSAYQIGDSNEPMDFPVSLREVTDIVMEMNHRQGVKKIIKRVIIPKLDDRRQKRLVEQTIDAVLPD